MKEITFEELIEEISPPYLVSDEGRELFGDLFDKPRDIFSKKELLQLMQQVAESKIAECEQYIRDNPEIALDFTRGREIKIDIPKDRILTEK